MMSKYQQCLKFFKTEKARKLKLDLGAKAVLLAIARECDRLQMESVEISDEKMVELVNEEIILLCTEKCKKVFKMIGDEYTPNEKMYAFMDAFCSRMDKDLEYLYKETSRLEKILKPLPMKKRKELVQKLQMVLN